MIGKPHFATSHTFEPTGTPECRGSMHLWGEDWNGPYMGFDHVELVIEGHNQWPPERPPSGQHYERWYYQDGLGDLKNELFSDQCRARHARRAADLAFRPAGRLAQLELGR